MFTIQLRLSFLFLMCFWLTFPSSISGAFLLSFLTFIFFSFPCHSFSSFSSPVSVGAFLEQCSSGSVRCIGQMCQTTPHWHLFLNVLSCLPHVLQWIALYPWAHLNCIAAVSCFVPHLVHMSSLVLYLGAVCALSSSVQALSFGRSLTFLLHLTTAPTATLAILTSITLSASSSRYLPSFMLSSILSRNSQ